MSCSEGLISDAYIVYTAALKGYVSRSCLGCRPMHHGVQALILIDCLAVVGLTCKLFAGTLVQPRICQASKSCSRRKRPARCAF